MKSLGSTSLSRALPSAASIVAANVTEGPAPVSPPLVDRELRSASGSWPEGDVWRGLLVGALPLMFLLPFVDTAFRIDDPMYIWAAQHIQLDPANPYGFMVNWNGVVQPMPEVMKNPPLVSYYIALVASLFGWSERVLHLALLLPSFLLGVGMYRLATRFCANPAVAALAGLFTPVFFVSSLTVMCDISGLTFFVWAVHFWVKGLDGDDHGALGLASLLISLSALTKYFGVALIPLLFAYSFAKQRRIGAWVFQFIIPIVVLAWYEWTTQRLYGHGLLLDAAAFATQMGPVYGKWATARSPIAFAFMGGCIASTLFFAHQLWSRRALLISVLLTTVVGAFIYFSRIFTPFLPNHHDGMVFLSAQFAIWGVAGVSLMVLGALDLQRSRNAESLLLFLWIIGTFVFARYVNWSTNARAILPMVVPAGILIVRRLERRNPEMPNLLHASIVPLALAAALSVAVARADSKFAETARVGQKRIAEMYPPRGRTVWFRGHWGFQYYMVQGGAIAVDVARPTPFALDDVMVIPGINSGVGDPTPPPWARIQKVVEVPSSRWMATMGNGAGFYSDNFGPLPFAIGPVPAERFSIVGVRPELRPK